VNKAFTDSNLYNPGGKTVILVILKTEPVLDVREQQAKK
jgi:hypothetical protein